MTGSTGPAADPADERRVAVLLVLPADPEGMTIGGIASFIRGFVKFAPDDFDVSIVGVSSTRRVGRWHRVRLEGRSLRFLPVTRGRAESRERVPLALRFVVGLVRYRRRFQADGLILSFHRPGTDLPFLWSRARRWRVVHLSVQDLATAGSESRWRRIPGLLARVERVGFGRMDRIYVVNEAVADEYRVRFPDVADRFRYLPNWADPTIFAAEPAALRSTTRRTIAQELELPPSGTRVLFAGRLEGQKHPRMLAKTFAELRSRHPSAHLVVAGEGSLEGSLRESLTALGAIDAVRFVGTVSKARLAQLMNACDVQLITSRYETGPTVGFESLACGLPIAMTNVGQVARVVEAGGAGRVVDAHTAEALAGGIEWILSQPPDRLRQAAVAAAAPFLADRVLGEVYEYNRSLTRDEVAA